MERAILSESRETEKSLPKDVLIDILFRMPADLLSRLFDNDSEFVKLHWERSIPKIIALGHPSEYYESVTLLYIAKDFKSLDVAWKYPPFEILKTYVVCGISHGVICLTERARYSWTWWNSAGSCQFSDVYLWNSLTNEKFVIQCPPVPSSFPANSYECKAVFGFGLLQDATICKVLRLLYVPYWHGSKGFRSHVSLYDVCTASWTDLPDLSTEIRNINPLIPVEMVNDCLHWIAAVSDDDARILGFNIKEETFQLMPTPISMRYSNLNVSKLSGQLCIFDNPPCKYLELWVMKEYGVKGSWTKLLKIKGSFKQLRPLCVAKNGQFFLKKHTETEHDHRRKYTVELMLYNVETKDMRKVKDFEHPLDFIQPFKESLISIRGMQKEARGDQRPSERE